MKIVREYIEFERTNDPYYNMGIGKKAMIEKWLKDYGINPDDYIIHDNLEIDIINDLYLVDKELTEFPEFIKFNHVYGGFYAAGNNWKSLKGFPRIIEGDLQLSSPSHLSGLKGEKFSEEEIRNLVKINGVIYNE